MAIRYMFPAYQIGMNVTPTHNQLEAATQTFKKGAVLIQNAAGYISEGGTNPTGIMGVAIIAGQNNASAGIVTSQFCPPLPGQVYEATLDDAGATPYTSVAADLGAQYGLTKDGSTSLWYVDHAKTAGNARVTIIQFKDPVGTSQARVYVVFKQAQTILN